MDILFPKSLAELECMLLTMGCRKADLSGVSARQDGARPAPGSHQRIAAVCTSRFFPRHQIAVTEQGVVVCALSQRPRLKPGHWLAFASEEPRRDFVDRRMPLSPAGTPGAVHVSERFSGEEWELLARLLREKRLLAFRRPAGLLNLGRDILHLPKRFIADAAWELREFRQEKEFSIDIQEDCWHFLRLCRDSAAFWTTDPKCKDALSKATFTGVTLPEFADEPWKLDDFPALFQALSDRCATPEFRERLARPGGIGFTYDSTRGCQSSAFTGVITLRNRRLCLNGTPVGREKLGYCLYEMQRCESPYEFDELVERAGRFSLKTMLAADLLPYEITVDNPWPFSYRPHMDSRTGKMASWKSERSSVECGGRQKLVISSPADFLKIGCENLVRDIHEFAEDSRATDLDAKRKSLTLLKAFVEKHPDRLLLLKGPRGRMSLKVKGKLGEYVIRGGAGSDMKVVERTSGRPGSISERPICIEGLSKDEEKRMPLADRMLARAMALLNDEASQRRIHTLRQPDSGGELTREYCQERIEILTETLQAGGLNEAERRTLTAALSEMRESLQRLERPEERASGIPNRQHLERRITLIDETIGELEEHRRVFFMNLEDPRISPAERLRLRAELNHISGMAEERIRERTQLVERQAEAIRRETARLLASGDEEEHDEEAQG